MSRDLALKALHLEPTDKIPHTEYLDHRQFVEELSGLSYTDPEAMGRVWTKLDLDFRFNTVKPDFGKGPLSSMGMAIYSSEGVRDYTVHCAFASVEEALSLDPVKAYGLAETDTQVAFYKDLYAQLRKRYPTAIVPGGIYRSMVSFCIDVFGWDMFLLALGTDPVRFGKIMEGFAEVILSHVKAWMQVNVDFFLTHDDIVWTSGPFAAPDWYRKHVFPYYKEYWKVVHDAGKKVLYCSDGNYNAFIDDIAEAGADGFIFEPMTDLDVICAKYSRTHVIIGNADCRAATFGTKQDIAAEIDRCLALGRDCRGYFFAWGNHLPDNIPMDNIKFAFEYFEQHRKR